jgi:hypothetical protein
VLDSPGREQKLGWTLLAAAMAVGIAFIFWLQRDLAFADDSFNWLALSGLGSDKVLIEPYGGHLIFTPLLVFKAVLGIVGASYTGFGVVQVVLLILLSGLLYEYGRRRVGPLLALPAAVIVLFLGSSWNVLMQPMLGIQFLCALVPGVAALLALERDDRRGDIAACVLLTLASWGFEMGLAFVVGAGVGIAMRSDRWRRAWIVGIPLLIYGIWRVWATQYGDSGLHLSNLLWVPAYAVDSLGVVAVSLFGLFYWVGAGQFTYLKLNGFDINRFGEGVVLLALEVFAAFLIVRRLRLRGRIPTTLWIAVAVLVTLWIEQGLALSPDRTPGEIRYIFPDTVVFLLVAVEAARGIRATRLAVIAAAALTVVAVVGNLARFKEGRDVLAEYSPPANAAITVVELGGSNIPPGFNPALDAPEAFAVDRGVYFGAGSIQEIAAKFGSPGYTVPELLSQSEAVRRSADVVAAHALGIHTEPGGASGRACHPQRGASDIAVLPPGKSILVSRRPSPMFARRFASRYVIEVGHVAPDSPVALRIPSDSADTPWRIQAPSSAGLTVCAF